MYCEVPIPFINLETNLQDQHSEKYHIKWENNSDDQKTLYSAARLYGCSDTRNVFI